jgi:hypothetical protein
MDNLHHPSPRLPEGWKGYQSDNIDIIPSSELTSNAGRHSRSPSVLSNHNYNPVMNMQLSQFQQQSNDGSLYVDPEIISSDLGEMSGNGDLEFGGPQFTTSTTTNEDTGASLPFGQTSMNNVYSDPKRAIFDDHRDTGSYFHPGATRGTASPGNTATGASQSHHHPRDTTDLNSINTNNHDNNLNSFDDIYISNPDPSTSSPSFFLSDQSPQLSSDTLSPFVPYQGPTEQFNTTSNNLGLRWTHHRSFSDQSDLSSNASPFVGSVHSEQNSPFLAPQPDLQFEDDLQEALEGLAMGAQFDIAAQQYNHHTFDTSNLELDSQGFPVDAFQQERQYYPQDHSRPTSSSSNYQTYTQNLFPQNTISIPQSYQSPPLGSATSIPEIEVTPAPPSRTGTFNNLDIPYYQATPYNQPVTSAHNSPSIQPSYIFPSPDIAPLGLPPAGRRRAVSDSGTRPSLAMPPAPSNLVRRVSTSSHPYLPMSQEGSPNASGRSTPARGHRKSFSSGHNMTHREVLDLVKNEGPREAKNPKKFVCDFPGCGQRFTRNSNKTYHLLDMD